MHAKIAIGRSRAAFCIDENARRHGRSIGLPARGSDYPAFALHSPTRLPVKLRTNS
jgi:hypothetical protein